MAPRTTFLITLAGVLLVGLPLPFLTRVTAPASVPRARADDEAAITAYATVRYTGQPQSMELRHRGRIWQVDPTASPAEIELELSGTTGLEMELRAAWDDAAPQAVTLTVEPDGLPPRTETQWKEEGSNTLQSIYSFTW